MVWHCAHYFLADGVGRWKVAASSAVWNWLSRLICVVQKCLEISIKKRIVGWWKPWQEATFLNRHVRPIYFDENNLLETSVVENEPEKVEGRKRSASCLFLFVEFSCESSVLASVWYVTHGISSFSMEREIWLFLQVDMCIIKERYEGKFSLFLIGYVSCNQRPEKVSRQSVGSAFPALSTYTRRWWIWLSKLVSFRAQCVCVYESTYWNETALYNRRVKAPMAARVQVNRLRHLDFLQLVGRCQIWNHRENSWPDRGFHRPYSHTAILQQWMCFYRLPSLQVCAPMRQLSSQANSLVFFCFDFRPTFYCIILCILQWRIKGEYDETFSPKRAVSLGACTFFFFWRTSAGGIVDFYLAATTHGDDLTKDKRKVEGKQGRASVESEKGRISSGRAAGREKIAFPFSLLWGARRKDRRKCRNAHSLRWTNWLAISQPAITVETRQIAKIVGRHEIDRSSFRHQLMTVPVVRVAVDEQNKRSSWWK